VTLPPTPERWAFDLTRLLNTAFGADRFDRSPVDVAALALDYSRQRFPKDPILAVKGDDLTGFDAALYPVASKGWAIIYNDAIRSKGRINFTLAHEFGHYLLHRQAYPEGIECGQQQIVRWDSEIGQVEHQANVFAANLLMPLDDFRRQIPDRAKVTFEMLEGCTSRYGVSLIAAVLRWLSYTEKRAVLVVSVDGYILWARSSKAALRTGAFFKTANRPPIEIPPCSLPLNPQALVDGRGDIHHGKGVWLPEPVRELTLSPEQYDFSLSLLLLDDVGGASLEEEREEEDTYDRFVRGSGQRREW
jgi:Zn-dependent peptidase ImmA (M78 family)